MKELVSTGDVAKMADVHQVTVHKWLERYSDVPQPVANTTAGAIYNRSDWARWLRNTGRKVEEDA